MRERRSSAAADSRSKRLGDLAAANASSSATAKKATMFLGLVLLLSAILGAVTAMQTFYQGSQHTREASEQRKVENRTVGGEASGELGGDPSGSSSEGLGRLGRRRRLDSKYI